MELNEIKANLENIIESVLFIAGDGVEIETLVEKIGVSRNEILTSIESLKKRFSKKSGICLINYNNKIQFSSNPNFADIISEVLNPTREKALSKATLETMAIVAYKQPVTRLEIEEIRGVSSDYAVQILIEHNLIEVVGRKDAVGKPLLFGTTDVFLKKFDLASLSELPNQEDLLERIKIVRQENSNSLYHDFKLGESAYQDDEKEFLEENETNDKNKLENGSNIVSDNNNFEKINNIKSNEENLVGNNCNIQHINGEDAQGKSAFEKLMQEVPEFLKDEKNLKYID